MIIIIILTKEVNLSYTERAEVDSIPWRQRHGIHASPYLFYLMIVGNEEECKELVVNEWICKSNRPI